MKVAKEKKRTRWSRSARREQLLAVAKAVVGSEGIRGLTMERLSEAAGISKPVVYSHFQNRSELLAALLRARREQDLIRRWTRQTVAQFAVSAEEAEHLAILYRGAFEAATSCVIRFPKKRRGIEEMCVRMAMASLGGAPRRKAVRASRAG